MIKSKKNETVKSETVKSASVNRGFNLSPATCHQIEFMKFDRVAKSYSAVVEMAVAALYAKHKAGKPS